MMEGSAVVGSGTGSRRRTGMDYAEGGAIKGSRRLTTGHWYKKEATEIRRALNRRFRRRVRALVRRDPEGAFPLPPKTEGYQTW